MNGGLGCRWVVSCEPFSMIPPSGYIVPSCMYTFMLTSIANACLLLSSLRLAKTRQNSLNKLDIMGMHRMLNYKLY